MKGDLPDFYGLADALWQLDAGFAASELHGLYSAVLAINQQYAAADLQQQVMPVESVAAEGSQDEFLQDALTRMHATILQQLNAGDLQFALLLPDEQDALDTRLLALQQWCQGFAYGMALSGLRTLDDLPSASHEWVQDVVRIGASGEFDLQDEEASELALQELIEFLRVGV
ncbi:MAG: YecA family protein [Thiolinea sp.]